LDIAEPLRPEDPREVGPYRLRGRLGAGGMGRVFLGRSPSGRAVAVKLIHPKLAEDAQFRRRFALEVESAGRVGGFYTAPVVDADTAADPPWLVTAYLPGPSLQDAVERCGPLPPVTIRKLGAGLAEGLAAIHVCGLVHRDLKPSNVIILDDGPRVIDFGIARALDAATRTATQVPIGTPSYMSPEHACGLVVGPPSDVFSLGMVLAFAATGANPFGAGPDQAIIYRIIHGDPSLTGLPTHLADLVADCLAKNPRDRPTITDILDRLTTRTVPDTTRWLPAEITAMIAERAALSTGQPPGDSGAAADTVAELSPGAESQLQQPSPDADALPATDRGAWRSRIRSGGVGCALFGMAFVAAVEAAARTPPIGPFQEGRTYRVGLLVLLLVLVYGVPRVVRQLLHYPAHLSKWRYTFGRNATYREARRTQRQVRQRRQSLHSKDHHEESVAKRHIKKMEKASKDEIRALEKQRNDAVRPPGPGEPIDELAGYLQLYEHVLVILPEDPTAGTRKSQMELDGLHATFQLGFNNTIIVLIWPNGTKRNLPIPHSRHSEDRVVKFEEQINDAVVRESRFRRQQHNWAADLDDQIGRAKSDAADKVEGARHELADLREAQRTNLERIRADADWEKQCEAWQALTGRRPPWLWWW
jgi:hypothetical protein